MTIQHSVAESGAPASTPTGSSPLGRPDEIAIIGGGLGGCALAITLHKYGVPVRIYEMRDDSYQRIGGGMLVKANGTRILKKLDLYSEIAPHGYECAYVSGRSRTNELNGIQCLGEPARHGSGALRIARKTILRILRERVASLGIKIQFHSKFGGIVRDSAAGGVEFLINGETQRAGLLVGIDGIHSKVRTYLEPSATPKYSGVLAIVAQIDAASIKWPEENYDLCTFVQDRPGAMLCFPDNHDASRIMVGTQFAYPEKDRQGWVDLVEDKETLCKLLKEKYDQWNGLNQQILDRMCEVPDEFVVWPFYTVPHLDRWYSNTGRVVIGGDAAHAVPPSSGQGVNQAFEDAFTLGTLLGSLGEKTPLLEGLRFWNEHRQDRINGILEWVRVQNLRRLPEEERLKVIQSGELPPEYKTREEAAPPMDWLFMPKIDEEMLTWTKAHA